MTVAVSHPSSNQLAFRGIAAFWVLLAHMIFRQDYNAGFAAMQDWGWAAMFIRFDFLAVDFFFVLSGCLLTLKYWTIFDLSTTSWQIDRFYLQRAFRLMPMHYFAAALIGLYEIYGIPHPLFADHQDAMMEHWKFTGLLNLVAMHGWGVFPSAAWNEPAWTVSAMFFVYILFPNLLLIMRKLSLGLRSYLALPYLLIIGYAILRMTVELGNNSDGIGGLTRALIFFAVGCTMARLHMQGWKEHWNWDKALAIAVGIFAVLVVLWWKWQQFDMVYFHLLYPCIMLGFLRANGKSHRILATRGACWLGGIAYSLYIMHYPLLLAIKYFFGGFLAELANAHAPGKIAAYVIVIAAILSVSWLCTQWIEKPIYRKMKNRLNIEKR